MFFIIKNIIINDYNQILCRIHLIEKYFAQYLYLRNYVLNKNDYQKKNKCDTSKM